MAKYVIMGGSGFALELATLLLDSGESLHGFMGPKPTLSLPAPWLGDDDQLASLPPSIEVLVAIGDTHLRQQVMRRVQQAGVSWGSWVHPSVVCASSAVISAGCVVYPYAVLHANVQLGEGVMINSQVSVAHESQVGAYNTLCPGVNVAGHCRLSEHVWVGLGANVVQGVDVAANITIGAGSTVINSLTKTGVYVGSPARYLHA
jgi:sugar O-acyltransferase (sialic acid O-acetyltransferase NeuD family)